MGHQLGLGFGINGRVPLTQGRCTKCGQFVYGPTIDARPHVDDPCPGDLDTFLLLVKNVKQLAGLVNPYHTDPQSGWDYCRYCSALKGDGHAETCPMKVEEQMMTVIAEFGMDPDEIHSQIRELLKPTKKEGDDVA